MLEEVSCSLCGGTGWQDCVRGYSCLTDPEQLIEYMADRTLIGENDGQVIVFEGIQTDTGFDDEPTVVPTKILQRLSWQEFLADTAEREER
ncbi:hypothetical protein [Nocardia sp. CNY236]|uniref:hypothetical protein n=1 Tax=Nocardia sp. CNY236 TaxID=1169152 RepID=UPI00048FFB84|nr:hypothetical protein [Nocardia sp. CNY236]